MEGRGGLPKRITVGPEDLVIGREFVTQQKGYAAERILLMGVDKGRERVDLFNVDQNKPFGGNLKRFMLGKVGYSRIIKASPIEEPTPTNASAVHPDDYKREPVVVMVIPKDNSSELVTAVITGEEGGLVNLTQVDNEYNPKSVIWRADPEALQAGEDQMNRYVVIPENPAPIPKGVRMISVAAQNGTSESTGNGHQQIADDEDNLARLSQSHHPGLFNPNTLLRVPHIAVIEERRGRKSLGSFEARIVGSIVKVKNGKPQESLLLRAGTFRERRGNELYELPLKLIIQGTGNDGFRVLSVFAEYTPKPPEDQKPN